MKVGKEVALKCCNKVVQILQSISLYDTATRTHRVLVVGRCRNPKCGALRAQIVYYDKTIGKFIHETINKKDVVATIQKYKDEPYLEKVDFNCRQGNYGNQHWLYGKTKVVEIEGKQYYEFWAYNFNGEKHYRGRKLIENAHTNSILSCN